MSQNDKSPLSSLLTLLTDRQWWKRSLADALLFAPHCILPASLLSLANISLVLSLYALSDTSSLTSLTLEQLTQKFTTGSIFGLFGVVLTMWALTIWLNRLTAFCRFRLSFQVDDRNKAISLALSDIGHSQKTLFKFWLIFSLYLLAPVIPLTFLILIQTVACSPTLQALNLFTIPTSINYILIAGIVILTVISAAMTVVATAMASKLNESPQLAASQSVKMFRNHGLALCSITALVLLVNMLVSAPQLLVIALQQAKPDLILEIISQIWLGVTSTVLWTISFCPALELLRRDLVPT